MRAAPDWSGHSVRSGHTACRRRGPAPAYAGNTGSGSPEDMASFQATQRADQTPATPGVRPGTRPARTMVAGGRYTPAHVGDARIRGGGRWCDASPCGQMAVCVDYMLRAGPRCRAGLRRAVGGTRSCICAYLFFRVTTHAGITCNIDVDPATPGDFLIVRVAVRDENEERNRHERAPFRTSTMTRANATTAQCKC